MTSLHVFQLHFLLPSPLPMAIGKPRGNKRPYGGSCSSTITAVVLTAVCVFGFWLIIISTSTTSRSNITTLINTSDQDDSMTVLKLNRKIPVDSTKDKLVDLAVNDTSVSQENVIQQNDAFQEMGQNNKLDDDGDRLAEPEIEPKEESTSNNIIDDDAESLNDSDVGKQEAEQHQEEAKEEQEIEIIEDNTNESDEKEHEQSLQKIKATDDQQTDDSGNQEDISTETGNVDDIHDLEDNQEQETTGQEHEKGIENQQEQEEPQEQNEDDGPIESHSIAAEIKARVENQEALDIKNKMEQAKIESTIATNSIPMIKASIVYSTVPNGDVNDSSDQSDKWELCNVTTGTDYIPCFDKEMSIRNLHQYEHKERHCPNEPPLCLVPLPKAYKTPIPWPQSRDKIWFHNVPNKALSDLKELQNWVKVTGEFITFPKGAHHYIEFLQEAEPEIVWGKQTRVVLDIGCGVANFGGYLFDKDVLAMSIASKDEHEAQIQFALERGIPAISNVMGTQRLPFPSRVFDLVHCVRCKVPWHKDGGIHLLEVNRLLRPGGYFVWSATPVYRALEEDVQVWKEMSALTVAMCWELVTIRKDKLNAIGVAIYHKPDYSNECYNVKKKQQPPMCKPDDDPNFAWYVPLQTCMHMVPMRETERSSHWPEAWPGRVQETPYWLNRYQVGIYGKPAPDEFKQDYEHWKQVISGSYMSDIRINWSNIRNVMDMRAVYGGFAAALKDLKLWVLNVVNVDSPDTLAIIFERGLLGIYHDWCESFSTYPRTYDLLHADHLFSNLKNRCKIKAVMAEIDRILRPGGNLIARDEPSMIREMEKLLKSLHWEVNATFMNEEGVISGQKSTWRPTTYVTPS